MASITLSGTFRAARQDADAGLFEIVEGNRFHWHSDKFDKLGTYQLSKGNDGRYLLQLSFNYARESTYFLTILHTEKEMITGFMLTDGEGNETSFRKI